MKHLIFIYILSLLSISMLDYTLMDFRGVQSYFFKFCILDVVWYKLDRLPAENCPYTTTIQNLKPAPHFVQSQGNVLSINYASWMPQGHGNLLPPRNTLLLFPFHLLPSPVHPTGFSFCFFLCFLAIFTLLSSNNK